MTAPDRIPRSIAPRRTGLEHLKEDGAPEEIRTPDPQIRSLVLYPAELRVRLSAVCFAGVAIL